MTTQMERVQERELATPPGNSPEAELEERRSGGVRPSCRTAWGWMCSWTRPCGWTTAGRRRQRCSRSRG